MCFRYFHAFRLSFPTAMEPAKGISLPVYDSRLCIGNRTFPQSVALNDAFFPAWYSERHSHYVGHSASPDSNSLTTLDSCPATGKEEIPAAFPILMFKERETVHTFHRSAVLFSFAFPYAAINKSIIFLLILG